MGARCSSKRHQHEKKLGLGIGETINEQIGKKIPCFSQAPKLYTMLPGVDKKLLDRNWQGPGTLPTQGSLQHQNRLIQQNVLESPQPGTLSKGKQANGLTAIAINFFMDPATEYRRSEIEKIRLALADFKNHYTKLLLNVSTAPFPSGCLATSTPWKCDSLRASSPLPGCVGAKASLSRCRSE